jgi:hypothetical protein
MRIDGPSPATIRPAAPDAREAVLAGVQEAHAEVAHQPFVGRAGAEIDAGVPDIDRHRTGGLDDVGVDQRTARVGDLAQGLQVVLEAVDGRDQ